MSKLDQPKRSSDETFENLCSSVVRLASAVQAQQPDMTFFVTSVGKGNGADLGGLEGG